MNSRGEIGKVLPRTSHLPSLVGRRLVNRPRLDFRHLSLIAPRRRQTPARVPVRPLVVVALGAVGPMRASCV